MTDGRTGSERLSMSSIWIMIGAAVLLLFAVVFGLRRAGRPIPYRGVHLAEVHRFVDSFLNQSGASSVFILERESGPGFLQIAVVDRLGGREQLELGLPDTEWSHSKFDSVKDALEAAGCFCTIDANSPPRVIQRFLRARFRGDHAELTSRVVAILSLVAATLGFSLDERYTLRMTGPTSPEYLRELANAIERTPGPIGHILASWLRRRRR
jgi:hypothetical protein